MHKLRPWNVNIFTVFVCKPVASKRATKTVSKCVIYNVHYSNVSLYEYPKGELQPMRGLTLIGEYFEPPRSLFGISIWSDAM